MQGQTTKKVELTIEVSENNHWSIERIAAELAAGYTGKIELNCFKGGVAAINKFESIKPPNHDQKKEGSK